MPRDKDFKRHVRARMQKTGESYTTARMHLVDRSATERPAELSAPQPPTEQPSELTPPQPPPDHAALAGMSDAAVAAKTGRTWQQWVTTLDDAGAAQMEHRDIARLLHEQYGVDSWWNQMVAVGYERIKGLRERGQRRGGSYEAGKSRTFDVPVGVLFDACADDATRHQWLTGADPVLTTASRPRSLRIRWDDGTLVALWFTEKTAAKSSVAVQHTKLPDRAAADRLKEYWSERLAALAGLLRER